MVPFLIASVVIVGLLGAVNLLFCFGVIRRLRERTDLLARLDSRVSAGPGKASAAPGDTVEDFAAQTVEGELVSSDQLVGATLVGFFSPNCPACEGQVDPFIAAAGEHPGGRSQVLAVVVGPQQDAGSYVNRLGRSARVVVEPDHGPVTKAFAVRGFPGFLMLHDGEVTASGFEIGQVLPNPVKA